MVARQRRTVRRQTLSDFGDHASAVKASLSGTAAVLHALPGAAALSGVSRQRRLCAFLIVNVAFMMVEFGYGYLNHSLGMLSDAAHMLLDNAAVVIGLVAERHAAKCTRGDSSSDPMRVRVLAGFANAVILLFVALNIVLEAGVHIMGGGHDVTTHRLLPVSVVGLLVNIIGLLFVHEAHTHHHAHGTACSSCTSGADPNMRAIFLHVLADTLGSLAVIASTLAVQRLHWHWADPLASVAIAALIVTAVWPLVRQSAAQLLETPPAPPPAQVLSALRFEESAAEPAAKPAAAPRSAPKAEQKAVKKQQQLAEPAAAREPAPRRQAAGITGEVVRRSPRKPSGQPAWLSDMVA